MSFSNESKRRLAAICNSQKFIEDLQWVLVHAWCVSDDRRKGYSFSLKDNKQFLKDLEQTTKALLALLDYKAKSRGIQVTAAEALLVGCMPEKVFNQWQEFLLTGNQELIPIPLPVVLPKTIENWKHSLKEILSCLPNSRRIQEAWYRRTRTHSELWQIVELLEFHFEEYKLPIKGKGANFEFCLAMILAEAGIIMEPDAIHRLIWKSRRERQKRFITYQLPNQSKNR